LSRASRSRPRRTLQAQRGAGAGVGQHLAVGRDQGHLPRAQLLAQPLQHQQLGLGRLGQPVGRVAGLADQIGRQGLQRALAQGQAGVQRALHAGVEPGLHAARDELVAHRVDQRPGQHAHQGEDAGQLEQQAAAELALAQPHRQAHRGHQQHHHQQRGHAHVDPEQPDELLLVAQGRWATSDSTKDSTSPCRQ
jgi:hypothetical protein